MRSNYLPSDPCQPWDISVDQLVLCNGASPGLARDFVILQWLAQGDTRPYSDFTARGHQPGREVTRYIGMMLNPSDDTEKEIPCRLEVRHRGRRGRPVNPQTAVRDGLIFDQVTRMKAERISYDGALDRVADMFPGDQRDMIEKAYKKECARRGN